MRITTVKHSQSELSCSRCGEKIRPSRDEEQQVTGRGGKLVTKPVRVLGDSYRWIKFNRRPRVVRCMKAGCAFRSSDLTTSEKLSRVYAARDTAEQQIAEWSGDAEDLKAILEDLANEVREVADEYGESADNMEQAFSGGSPTIDDCREKQDQLTEWADEIEGVEITEWAPVEKEEEGAGEAPEGEEEGEEEEEEEETKKEDDEPRNDEGQTREEWADEQRGAAEEVAGGCPL
jgi:uncharacterized protein YfcZ (UPF0381/DUF406 family)